ncbi:uncharacterized protein BDW47DRAFT_106902 [Aspergillus candidus]|uniref:Uncharacterized protein n=1 Tax=Aspergillus candidus TaxID=41067 RepID=A0A2I2F9S0_ASPCN|nr:hypothetical protein BDW47DRAFT_106902 [Aspergillus candidus]PLB37371.1 hypothetical protein BDW47DRAFT_106902 [Aspergillus candidus]
MSCGASDSVRSQAVRWGEQTATRRISVHVMPCADDSSLSLSSCLYPSCLYRNKRARKSRVTAQNEDSTVCIPQRRRFGPLAGKRSRLRLSWYGQDTVATAAHDEEANQTCSFHSETNSSDITSNSIPKQSQSNPIALENNRPIKIQGGGSVKTNRTRWRLRCLGHC